MTRVDSQLPRLLLGASVIAVVCLLAFFWLLLLKELAVSHVVSGISGLIVITVVVIWLVGKAMLGRMHLFEPQVTGGLMLLILFGVRPFVMTVAGDTQYYRWLYIGGSFGEAVQMGMVATLIFMASCETAMLPWARRQSSGVRRLGAYDATNFGLLNIYVSILALMSVVLFALQLHLYGGIWYSIRQLIMGHSQLLSAGAKALSEYLSSAPVLATCGAALLILANRGSFASRRTVVYIALLMGYPILVFLLTGERRFMIPAIGIPIVAYYLITRKKFPLRVLMVLVPLLAVVVASVPYLRQPEGRKDIGGLRGYLNLIVEHPGDVAKTIFLRGDTEMVPVLAVEMNYLKRSGNYYDGAASLGDLLLAPIPGSVFPDKPMTARNNLLVHLFGSPCVTGYRGICPDYSAVGTFYQDAGWIGALVGMIIMGAISGLIWRTYRSNRNSITAAAVASCWTVMMPIFLRAGFMPGFAWFLYFMVPIGAGVLIFAWKPMGGRAVVE